MSTHTDRVVQQFGDRAMSYLTSPVHATGEDLSFLKERANALKPRRVLDVGSGAGHASFAVAPYAGRVTALDPSSEMLRALEKGAADRSIGNIDVRAGRSDALPFEAATFDLVVSRFSAHHWANPSASLNECRRVITPGGTLLIIDSSASEDGLRDTWLQTLELLRDTTHVRSYRPSEWAEMLGMAGFSLRSLDVQKLRVLFNPWVERSGTPAPLVASIRHLFDTAPDEVRESLSIGKDNDFTLDYVLIAAVM